MLRALPRDQTKEHRGARDSFADRCQREPALSCRAGIAPDRGDGGDLHGAVKGETINRMDTNAARLCGRVQGRLSMIKSFLAIATLKLGGKIDVVIQSGP